MIGPVLVALSLQSAAAVDVVEHEVTVSVQPAAGGIEWVDRLRVPAALKAFSIELHPGLTATITGARVVKHDQQRGAFDLEREADVVVVTARGRIVSPPVQAATEHQRSFQETAGTIEARGVYLSPGSRWLPAVVDDNGVGLLASGSVTVTGLPPGWSALSEGALQRDDKDGVTWRETKALEGFHLIAGPFSKVKETRRGVDVMIWLRQGDGPQGRSDAPDAQALADRYLEVTGQYLEQYETLIGKYPYAKFALVENFWETGYGMPSFTLLGSQVLRFPFILHTSWPHELLHNWWGNGVFVGAGGNWSEGLTAYLADHLNAEQQGKGAEHRRTTLQKYLDFVDVDGASPGLQGKDFPLVDFRGRDSAASEAIGYGKTLMLFHMVRRQVGDAAFAKGLQLLWTSKQQQPATFDDVAAAFSQASGSSLAPFFTAWTTQTGIPTLALRSVAEARSKSGVRTVIVVVEQTQAGPLFPLEVPVVFTTVDGRSIASRVRLKDRSGTTSVQLPGAALARVDVDPFFDVFRRLSASEVPPSLSRALGARKMVFVTPTFASKDEQAAWGAFAKAICAEEGNAGRCTVVDDQQVGTLPKDAAVWILGYGSYLRGGAFVFTKPRGLRFDDRGVFPPGAWERVLAAKGTTDRLAALKKERVDPAATGFAVVVDHPRNPALAMAFVGAPSAKMIPQLARKLPHYGKYAWVGFSGDDATNNLKGQWSPSSSSLTFFAGGTQTALALKEPAPLATLPPPFDGAVLLDTVKALSDSKLEGRGRDSEGLQTARKMVQEKLVTAGIKATSIDCDATDKTICNVVARLPGTDPTLARVVLGAHLDHLGKQKKKVFPGADDNASGVAVALEVARQLSKSPGARGVDVVFFDAEESGRLGSLSYLARAPKGSIHSMVNLDTVGRLQDQKPLLVLDGDSATEWVHIARGVGFTTGIAVELAPQGGGASDQQSFREQGIPAIQLFSGPNADYHQPTDTADKVSSSSLVKAAVVTREIVAYLRDRKEPLTAKGAAPASTPTSERRASLGSVPDMRFKGPGVRFDDVVTGSPAERAGLKTGDVLVRFDGGAVTDLRSYSELLKPKKPGDTVKVVVLRDGKEVAVDVVLGAR